MSTTITLYAVIFSALCLVYQPCLAQTTDATALRPSLSGHKERYPIFPSIVERAGSVVRDL